MSVESKEKGSPDGKANAEVPFQGLVARPVQDIHEQKRGEVSSPIRNVLSIRPFRNLWSAQAVAQTAQNAFRFILIVLVERLTGSTIHLGLIILAFTLPGAILGPVAGALVDRWSKRWILITSNLARAVLVFSYIPLVHFLRPGWSELTLIYALTFVTSSVSQFFSPAESSTIPLIVDEEGLMAANSLFNFTLAGAQFFGWVMVAPLVLKLFGMEAAFGVMAIMYAIAAAILTRIQVREERHAFRTVASEMENRWLDMMREIKDGWDFVRYNPPIYVSLGYLTLVSTLLMIIGMIGPGFAARVLGLAAEDSYIVFAPAGIGMVITTLALGTVGHTISNKHLADMAIGGTAIGFWGLYLVSRGYNELQVPIFHIRPEEFFDITSAVVVLSLLLGASMTTLNVVGQTNLQKYSLPEMRGRVFSLQFVLGSIVSALPMLLVGGLADIIGIPRVMEWIAYVLIAVLALNYWLNRRVWIEDDVHLPPGGQT